MFLQQLRLVKKEAPPFDRHIFHSFENRIMECQSISLPLGPVEWKPLKTQTQKIKTYNLPSSPSLLRSWAVLILESTFSSNTFSLRQKERIKKYNIEGYLEILNQQREIKEAIIIKIFLDNSWAIQVVIQRENSDEISPIKANPERARNMIIRAHVQKKTREGNLPHRNREGGRKKKGGGRT